MPGPRRQSRDYGSVAAEIADHVAAGAPEPARTLGGEKAAGHGFLLAFEEIMHDANGRAAKCSPKMPCEEGVGGDTALAEAGRALDAADQGEPGVPGDGGCRVLVQRVEEKMNVARVEDEVVAVEQHPHAGGPGPRHEARDRGVIADATDDEDGEPRKLLR